MKIVVNDANILFDLLDIDLIEDFCKLPYEKLLTDAVLGEFDEETLSGFRSVFEEKRLCIYPLTEDQIKKVSSLKATYSAALSFPDCSCLFLAQELSAILLTGDKPLRKTAQANKVRSHGSLWVIDQLIQEKIISYQTAHRKLTLLMQINKRLPLPECNRRLRSWATQFAS